MNTLTLMLVIAGAYGLGAYTEYTINRERQNRADNADTD